MNDVDGASQPERRGKGNTGPRGPMGPPGDFAMSFEEIGEALGISSSSARNLYSSAMTKLQRRSQTQKLKDMLELMKAKGSLV